MMIGGREQRVVVTQRQCQARLVPDGTEVTIPADAFVTVTQTLGGNFTVTFQGNMARIDGNDADALGLPVELPEYEQPAGTEIDPDQVETALRSVYDPEIPVNLKDLGLIYSCEVDGSTVRIHMTLTAPGCGMGPVLVRDVCTRVEQVPNVQQVDVQLVFDPPWDRSMMTEEAQLELGLL